ncbi:MAG: PFL family protein, partial [Synergistaceae bacterium]|nr:PFL family protein [Synergistaceae bacterium]
MITISEARETIRMISEANLDVRTITMGISLLDCADSDSSAFCRKIYDKITRKAEHLARVGDDISKEYGVPVVNKRISVTPVAIAAAGCRCDDYVEVANTLDRAAATVGVNFIGGFSALVHKGITPEDRKLLDSIPPALSVTERVCSSVGVASTKSGINMDAVNIVARILKDTAMMTSGRDSIGCAKFVVFCNAVEDNPFMAGAFHGVGEPDAAINVGVSGPGVVKRAIESVRGADFETLCETVKRTAFKITRVGQLVAQEASRRLNVPFGVIDLSLAPTPAAGDSIAEILQEMGLEQPGAPGTTAAVAILNDNVKKGGVMASSYVGGLSGAFIPVSEDHGMIEAVRVGALSLE